MIALFYRAREAVSEAVNTHPALFIVPLVGVVIAYFVFIEPETAESYCRDIYADGGKTPSWAADHAGFYNYDSCVERYRAAREDAGPP